MSTIRSTSIVVAAAAVIATAAYWMLSKDDAERKRTAAVEVVSTVPSPVVAPPPVAVAPATAAPDELTILVSPSAEATELHRQVAARTSDDAIARAEQRVASALQAGSPLAATAQEMTVRCSATLCEMTGIVSADPAEVRRDLANALWRDTLPRLGYAPGPTIVAEGRPPVRFVQYITRLK